MTDTRNFTTLPANAIGDSTLTSLDLRCLAAISIHDGMSLIKETGAGCYAALSTLARKVGTDVTNFSKSLSKLIRKGYVVKEPQLHDKRRSTLRVVFPKQKTNRHDGTEGRGSTIPSGRNTSGAATQQASQVVGGDESENGRNPSVSGMQYISLNEELDSEESWKEISTNEELDSEEPEKDIRLKARIEDSKPQARSNHARYDEEDEFGPKLAPELAAGIHKSFNKLNPGAQVIKIERRLRPRLVGKHHLSERVIDELCSFLDQIHELYPDDKAGLQAFRLSEELAQYDRS